MIDQRILRQINVIKTFIHEEGQATGAVSGQMALQALDMIRDLLSDELVWSWSKPCREGLYLYKNDREWPIRLVEAKYGNWQLAQNPEWLYGYDKPLTRMEPGLWLGPLPRPSQGMFHNDD